ncbi:hypothetical protein BKA60DRAFT_589052 [Fusarium oxysporum]|nr:hypothetical protein BKA60DRAFT_589052 [Fusarium oxysporum]
MSSRLGLVRTAKIKAFPVNSESPDAVVIGGGKSCHLNASKPPDLRNTDKNDNNIIECAQEPTLHRDALSQENPLTQYTTQVPPPPSTPTVSAPECNSPTQTIRSTHVLHRKPDVLDEPSTSQQGHGTCKHKVTFRSSPPKMRMATLAYHGDFEVTTSNSLATKSIRIPPATPLVGPPNLARFGPRFQPCFCTSHHNTITMPRGKELSLSLWSRICES